MKTKQFNTLSRSIIRIVFFEIVYTTFHVRLSKFFVK